MISFFRSYRAPELLFSPPTYSSEAIDRWSLGVLLSEFFTPLMFSCSEGGQSPTPSFTSSLIDDDASSPPLSSTIARKGWQEPFETGDYENGAGGGGGTRGSYFETKTWERRKLFEGERGDVGLAGSIFSIRGSPGKESWPVSFPAPLFQALQTPWNDLTFSTHLLALAGIRLPPGRAQDSFPFDTLRPSSPPPASQPPSPIHGPLLCLLLLDRSPPPSSSSSPPSSNHHSTIRQPNTPLASLIPSRPRPRTTKLSSQDREASLLLCSDGRGLAAEREIRSQDRGSEGSLELERERVEGVGGRLGGWVRRGARWGYVNEWRGVSVTGLDVERAAEGKLLVGKEAGGRRRGTR